MAFCLNNPKIETKKVYPIYDIENQHDVTYINFQSLETLNEEIVSDGDVFVSMNQDTLLDNYNNFTENYIIRHYANYTPEKYNTDVVIRYHIEGNGDIIYSMMFKDSISTIPNIFNSNQTMLSMGFLWGEIKNLAWEKSGIKNITISDYTKEEFKSRYNDDRMSRIELSRLYYMGGFVSNPTGFYSGTFTFSDGSAINGGKQLLEYIYGPIINVYLNEDKVPLWAEPTIANLKNSYNNRYTWLKTDSVNVYEVEENETMSDWPENQEFIYTPSEGQKYYKMSMSQMDNVTEIKEGMVFTGGEEGSAIDNDILYTPKLLYGEEKVLNSLLYMVMDTYILLHVPCSLNTIKLPEQYSTINKSISSYIFIDDTQFDTLVTNQKNIEYIIIEKDINEKLAEYGGQTLLNIILGTYTRYANKFIYNGKEYTYAELAKLA